MDLDPHYRDKFGNPLLRITFDWQPNERAMVAYAGKKTLPIMQEMIPNGQSQRAARCRRPRRASSPAVPARSGALRHDVVPVDAQHGRRDHGRRSEHVRREQLPQMWDASNVFVVGACNFPQNAGFNPTGTVGALAYRAAEASSSTTRTAAASYERPRRIRRQVGCDEGRRRRRRCARRGRHSQPRGRDETDLVFPVGEPPRAST